MNECESFLNSRFVRCAPAVRHALLSGSRPVVALESTIITHGMPWPQNLETAKRVEDVVKSGGAVPATIAILDGFVCIGLTADQLERLAKKGTAARKTSARDIGYVMATPGLVGATTVSSTSLLAARAGIQVFVTGGIGGVHRGAQQTWDVSADLDTLAQTPIVVVCAGPKSVLDLELTLEYLETKGVSVVSYQQSNLPAFFSHDSGVRAPLRADDAGAVARAFAASVHGARLSAATVLAVPIQERDQTIGAEEVEQATRQALAEADSKGLRGPDVTPFILARVAELTDNRSLQANIALVMNNARVGTAVAGELHRLLDSSETNSASDDPFDCVVVGGLLLDITSRPAPSLGHLVPGESNPGQTSVSLGGVAGNIAVALSSPIPKTLLISCVASDLLGKFVMNRMVEAGLAVDGILQVPSDGLRTATYTCVLDEKGDLSVAVADTAILEQILTPYSLEPYTKFLSKAKLVIVDGNLNPETTHFVCQVARNSGTRVWFEPTSAAKAARVRDSPLIGYLDFMSPNSMELLALAGKNIGSIRDADADLARLKRAARQVLRGGAGPQGLAIVCKRGPHGVLVAVQPATKPGRGGKNKGKIEFYEFPSAPIAHANKNVTGAGDALVAGVVGAMYGKNSYSLVGAIPVGIEKARQAIVRGANGPIKATL